MLIFLTSAYKYVEPEEFVNDLFFALAFPAAYLVHLVMLSNVQAGIFHYEHTAAVASIRREKLNCFRLWSVGSIS